jgi:hypothetical protein
MPEKPRPAAKSNAVKDEDGKYGESGNENSRRQFRINANEKLGCGMSAIAKFAEKNDRLRRKKKTKSPWERLIQLFK